MPHLHAVFILPVAHTSLPRPGHEWMFPDYTERKQEPGIEAVNISASTLEKWNKEHQKSNSEPQLPPLESIFGTGKFEIQPEEIKEFMKVEVQNSGDVMTERFYDELVRIIQDDKYVLYFDRNRQHSLKDLAEGNHVDCVCDPKCESGCITAKEAVFRLNAVLGKDKNELGFRTQADMDSAKRMSLTELSTCLVVTCEGHFFVGNNNQIMERTTDQKTVLLISAAGIDFSKSKQSKLDELDEPDKLDESSPSKRERERYFTSDQNDDKDTYSYTHPYTDLHPRIYHVFVIEPTCN